MYKIGVDIGGTKIKIGAIKIKKENVNLQRKLSNKIKCDFLSASVAASRKQAYKKQKIVKSNANLNELIIGKEIPFSKHISHSEICSNIAENILQIVKQDEIDSVGIAVPGIVDNEGNIRNAYNLDFHGVPLKKMFKSQFPDIPINICNDADAATFGEMEKGALRNIKTGVMLTIGTGIGGGLVLDGKLFRGGQGNGTELGHIMLRYGKEECSCGNKGCIETYCSASWLSKKAKEYSIGDTAKDIFNEVNCGNLKAIEILEQYTDNLGTAIASIINLIDPEIVVIGGGISATGDVLFTPLNKVVKNKNFFKKSYKIVPAANGNYAGVIGAALWI